MAGCVPCAALVLAADSVDMGRLVKEAVAMKGRPLAFCDACKGGEHAADSDGYGLTPSELIGVLAADAPAVPSDLVWWLVYHDGDGRVTYHIRQGIRVAHGALRPEVVGNQDAAMYFLRGQLNEIGITPPPGWSVIIPDVFAPVSQGSIPGFMLPRVTRRDRRIAMKVRIFVLAGLLVAGAIYLWKERHK